MPCGGCSKRRAARKTRQIARESSDRADLFGGYSSLSTQQIKVRLELYKKRYCKNCIKRYECDYEMYTNCKKQK